MRVLTGPATTKDGLRGSSLGRDAVWIMADPRKKITVALAAEIVAHTRDVVGDADLPGAAVIERALHAFLLGRLLDATQATSDLTADQADQFAVGEVRAYPRAWPRRVASVVIDPSVYVSALIGRPGSAPDLVVRAAIDDKLAVVVCPLLIRELESVLARPSSGGT